MKRKLGKRLLLAGLAAAIGLGAILAGGDRRPASATGYWAQWEVWGASGTGEGQFNHPMGIAIDAEGYVYVADSGNKRIQKFDSEGRFVREWSRPGPGKPGVDLKNPTDIAFDAAGNMYISDTDGDAVKKIDANGNHDSRWTVGGLKGPRGITVNGEGNLVVVNSKTVHGKLTEFAPSDGAIVREYESNGGPADFGAARDVVAHPNGTMYIADTYHSKISMWTKDRGAEGFNIVGMDTSGIREPSSIAIDPQGTFYIADQAYNRIVRVADTGAYIEQWGGTGSLPGRFDSPGGVAVDKNGNLYVADTNNNRIQKLARKLSVSANELTPDLRQALNATAPAPALTVVAGQPFSVVLAGFADRIPDGTYGGVAVAASADRKYATLTGRLDAEGVQVIPMNGVDIVFQVVPPPSAGSVQVSF